MYPVAERERALALLEGCWSLSAVSSHLGMSRAAVREWRDRGVEPRSPSAGCFRCEKSQPDPPAYAALLGYYLGDGCVDQLVRTCSLRISCDRSYPEIIADVTDVMAAVHRRGKVGHVRAPGVVVVKGYWKHWPCLFPQHGPGRKHERALTLEPWQQAIVERHSPAFLRGLFHSDGCRVNNWATRVVAGERKRYDYPRWQFTNNSPDIRRWCCEALDLVGVPWRQSNWKTISVSTRASVARLDELIGPKR